MAGNQLEMGDVIKVMLPKNTPSGHEQEGRRPALVVGSFESLGTMRFPMILIAPMTTQIDRWATQNTTLYPLLTAGTVGLSEDSVVLLDQIRAVSLSRLLTFLGTLQPQQVEPIHKTLQTIVGTKAAF
jgi:mRNA interferase MazF